MSTKRPIEKGKTNNLNEKAGNKAVPRLINANTQVNDILVASDPIVLTALII